jgi:glycosyltransferase involved in cell wall biosynthesis
MIALLHAYLLEGSGSNLWTRSIVQSLCQNGETIHLMCQENHPELYDFICETILYHPDGRRETILQRESVYPGKCIMHKPILGNTLPVYVEDKYEEFSNPQPMVNLKTDAIESYLKLNIQVLDYIVKEHKIRVIHVNHAVLMSVVAQRVSGKHGIPYAIMPHGSAIEYAVKKDSRFFNYAERAFDQARRIYVIGKEIRKRVKDLFPSLTAVETKMMELNLGVDTSLFNTVPVSQRRAKIDELYGLLQGIKRGKTEEQEKLLQKRLKADITKQELKQLLSTASAYNAKMTDEHLEEKLKDIDWEHEKILLYVGRLIASKGVHSVLVSFVEILAQEPDSRLIVVGHGPQREVLETLIWALKNGHKDLVYSITQWGRELENNGNKSLEEIQSYFDYLKNQDKIDSFFQKAQNNLAHKKVIFTGYLTHRELCSLFPVCDVAVFPSVVPEAGPLVFLEAMASGCFPVGTYFAGMAASIDSVSESLPSEVTDLMKLSHHADKTVSDIIHNVKRAFYVDEVYKQKLRSVAIEKYDWKNISVRLADDLYERHV